MGYSKATLALRLKAQKVRLGNRKTLLTAQIDRLKSVYETRAAPLQSRIDCVNNELRVIDQRIAKLE